MKRFHLTALAGLVVLTCSACSGSRTANFPPPRAPEISAEVVVLRNQNLWGAGLPMKVLCDGWVVASVGVGEYVQFFVPPGSHSVGITHNTAAFEFEAAEAYYFVVSPDGFSDNFEIERVGPQRGRELLEAYSPVE